MLLGRRKFVAVAVGAAASCSTFGRLALAATPRAAHTLSFFHIHTAEKLTVTYREHGQVLPDALAAINHYLRDFRTDQSHDIDVALLDSLADLHAAFDGRGNFEVISGYRSPRTNEALRHATSGVAEKSLHIHGRAIDVRLTSARTRDLRDAAVAQKRGGVGYYAESNFVHVDTGAFRTW
jgi:uncharacterized protein YcbK (DUF882 family)